jgi:ribonuclease III
MALQDPLVAVLQFPLIVEMTKRKAPEATALSARLGYGFRDAQLLELALTHGSLPKASDNYERLEFLGDRVLGLVIAEALYRQHGGEREGKLAARHSALVRGDVCADIAEKLGLDEIIRVGVVEKKQGVNRIRSILGDVMEAVIGAIYLDSGMDAARDFVMLHWKDLLALPETARKDAKTFVQEWILARGTTLPAYDVIERSGPEHMPEFTVKLTLPGFGDALGKGRSKQLAEMAAAQKFIESGRLRK